MKFSDVIKWFVPKNDSFFPYFEGQAQCIVKASVILYEMLTTKKVAEERRELVKQIKKIENEGDAFTHQVYNQLDKSFLTPFDREDIHQLASSLDDVLDCIYSVSQRIYWYKAKAKKVGEEVKDFAGIIKDAAIEIETAVVHLRDAGKNREKIRASCVNLNTLENKADELFFIYMSDLFEDEEKDAIDIIKKKDIIETLERCVDAAEDVSDIIKTILIKNQ
ncbi:MAG TPA: DUF47 family protein [Bacteroidales bacterium]|nr:DUF47 family protein [Bacteroidales bacterium]HPS73544.1 DUF47 family protein [Bacteroidales bacterium]